ncbi:aldo/keto reductase [Neisseria iguanae]|uniref:Aldo/keto reductase n=1 Tax=Neisseria iguanae TaxID=90242 RepID=A0A2P7U3F3_9NEIS|nr:aldo/keto reductase [Neisseria iguanae]PSJ81476.1 aldo/keto reductase [Neisseria iguanae]
MVSRRQRFDASRRNCRIALWLGTGVSIIDTAEMCGNGRSENLVGEAIQPFICDSIYLISKVLPGNANSHNLECSLDVSLYRLQTGYLDMYLYHWRGATSLPETVELMEKMVQKGKIKAWGVSNFDFEDMHELHDGGGTNCETNEVLYYLESRGIEFVLEPWQDANSISTIAYCPLAQAGELQDDLLHHPEMRQIADELNISVYQVLLCFTLAQQNMVSIPRTGKTAHMKELADCLDIRLPAGQYAALDEAFPALQRHVPLDISKGR